MNRYLVTYLKEHLAGSQAGLRRFQSAARNNKGTPLGAFLSKCVEEVKGDRAALKAALRAAGGRRPVLAEPVAFVGERLARLKPDRKAGKYSPLARVEDLEALCLGVLGKLRLWKVLFELSKKNPALAVADFDALYTRAEQQAEELERFRFIAAMHAFKGRGERSPMYETSEAALAH